MDLSQWKRNLFFVSLSQFIAMVGMSAFVPFMPLFVFDLGISNIEEAKIWSGLVFAGPYFLSVITVPIWGYLGDKYGKKLMMLRALYGLTLAVFLMGFSQNIYHLFFLRVFQGAVSGIVAAALAFTASNTPKEKSGYAIGILQGSQSAGNIVGPLIGGILSDIAGFRYTFFIVAALIFISTLCVTFFVDEKNKGAIRQASSFISNLKIMSNTPAIPFILVLIIISQAGIQYTNPIFPYFISKLGAPKELLSTITGLLVGIVGLFSVIFAPYWGKRNDKKDYLKTIYVSTGIIGIAAILHIVVTNYIYLFPLRIIIGIFFAAVIPTLYSALNKMVSNEHIGSIMGWASSANLIGSLIAFLACGFISSWLGLESAFIISGVLLLIVSILAKIYKIKQNKVKA
ncbi:MAG TPA: MFS transporter [Candidatus Kapabacteria bacterium]|nr:MFS transporter [Candidatus Kapabacteria bacterium]